MTTAATTDESSDGDAPNSSNIWGKSHRILERNDSCVSMDFGGDEQGSPEPDEKVPKANGSVHLGEGLGSEEDDVVGLLPNGGSHHSASSTQAAHLSLTAKDISTSMMSRTQSATSIISITAVDGSTASGDGSAFVTEPDTTTTATSTTAVDGSIASGDGSSLAAEPDPTTAASTTTAVDGSTASGDSNAVAATADSTAATSTTAVDSSFAGGDQDPAAESDATAATSTPAVDGSTASGDQDAAASELETSTPAEKQNFTGNGPIQETGASKEAIQPERQSANAAVPEQPKAATPTPSAAGSEGAQPATPRSGGSDGPQPRTPRGTALSPASRPFVPGKASPPQQSTPRKEEANGEGAAVLNVNAAAFVPQGGANPTPLQFGDLPDSLNPSPHLSTHDHHEWPGKPVDGYPTPAPLAGEGSGPGDQGEWGSAWMEHYEYAGGYAEQQGMYTDANGYTYYQQADESWVLYDPHAAVDGHWGYDAEGYALEGYPVEGYEQEYTNGHQSGHEGYEDSQQGGRRRGRGGRGSRRGSDRRRGPESRGSWADAAVDVLEQHFSYSRESLHEMLDLHEGNLEVALDMLAQLEAETDGQLPATGQDAPQMTEENFPSLGGSATTSPTPAPSAPDFAAALKAPATGPPGLSNGGSKPVARNPKPAEAGASPNSTPLPWVETGEAVSQTYESARADARDHARLRNQYFQEATKAFMAGRKALARDLGAKGREQSELMKAAHVEASQAIYKHRNPVSGRNKGKGPGLVDLHGLHAKEAVAFLGQQVEAARRSKTKNGRGSPSSQRMSVLVGTGHHTKGSRTPARLPAAVEEWLTASQISFCAPEPGVLELSL